MDLTKEILEILNSDAKEFEGNAKVLALFSDSFEDKAKEINALFDLYDSSLHVKEKSTPTFEEWLIDNKYVITKATYITQYGHLVSREFLWHKYIEESQL